MNLANATPITGQTGSLNGTNVGQSGDLSNWFKWTPPAAGTYFFSTRNSLKSPGATPSSFKTTVNAFFVTNPPPPSPVVMSALTMFAYVSGGGNEPNGYGYENGALCAFVITDATQNYYIQVNSRDGGTGNFNLEWALFNALTLGGCSDCTPASGDLCKTGGVFATPDTFISLGGFPAGLYVFQACGIPTSTPSGTILALHSGTFEKVNGGNTANVQPWNSGIFLAGSLVTVGDGCSIYVATSDVASGDPAPGQPGSAWAGGVADCMSIGACSFAIICHSGGEIGILARSAGFNGIQHSSGVSLGPIGNVSLSLLTFSLNDNVAVTLQSISNGGFANGVDSSAGFKYSVTFKLTNKNLIYPTSQFENYFGQSAGPHQIQLLSVSGGSAISAPVQFDLNANSSTTVTFTFNSTATDLMTATFQLSSCVTNVPSEENSEAAQTITLATGMLSAQTIGSFGFCTGVVIITNPQQSQILISCGVIPVSNVVLTLASTNANALFFSDPAQANPCAGSFVNHGWTKNLGTVYPNAGETILVAQERSTSAESTIQPVTGALTSNSPPTPPFTYTPFLF